MEIPGRTKFWVTCTELQARVTGGNIYRFTTVTDSRLPACRQIAFRQCCTRWLWKSVWSFIKRLPASKNSWGQHGTRLGRVGPRWASWWPHVPCYQGLQELLASYFMHTNEKVAMMITSHRWHQRSSYWQQQQGCQSDCPTPLHVPKARGTGVLNGRMAPTAITIRQND